jgi:hypothetical protein
LRDVRDGYGDQLFCPGRQHAVGDHAFAERLEGGQRLGRKLLACFRDGCARCRIERFVHDSALKIRWGNVGVACGQPQSMTIRYRIGEPDHK